jgi:formylglycine-generating enzyme required for sulfatase activity
VPGTRLGDFELIERIGGGGMGEVFLARQLSLGRRVALKVPRPQLAEDENFRHRFLREARNAARLSNPYIVQVYSVGEESGTLYLGMEYVAGETLRQRLARGRLSLEELVRIGVELCEALGTAHAFEDPDTGARGIIHRDVKPENIFLEERTGRAKLGDFGLSRAAGDVSLTSRALGTPAYASPEQCLGGQVDHRSDIYSLGLVLYEALTGRSLSAPPTPEAVPLPYAIKQHAAPEPPPAPHELDPAVPPELSAAVMRAFAHRPEDRFQSAAELAAALQATVVSAPTQVDTPSLPAAYTPDIEATQHIAAPKRRRVSVGLVVALCLLIPVLLFVGVLGLLAGIGCMKGFLEGATREMLASHLGNEGPQWEPGLTPEDMFWGGNDEAYPDQFVVNPVDLAEMVWVPGGTFEMGSGPQELDRLWKEGGWDDAWRTRAAHESPAHEVTLEGFWIYRHEVTNAQYASFLDATTNVARETTDFAEQHEHHPRVSVQWTGAAGYAEWAGVRLPTEAEWEYAARGPEGRTYPWGDTWDRGNCNSAEHWAGRPLKDPESWSEWLAEMGGEKKAEGGWVVKRSVAVACLKDVGSFPDNASWCGALDLAGSVYEWCADWHDEKYYESSPSDNPRGPDEGSERVVRGGSWAAVAVNCRTGYRTAEPPNDTNLDYGFRCAVSAEAQ